MDMAQIRLALGGMAKDLQSLKQKYADLKESADPQALAEKLPGKRVPFKYSLDLEWTAGDENPISSSFTISQDGHFIATGLMGVSRATAGLDIGRFRPASSLDINLDGAGTFAAAAVPLDFLFEIRDQNSDRAWQNAPMPSSLLFTTNSKGLYFPVGSFLDKNTTITVIGTPTRPPDEDSVTTITFDGYKIVDPTPFRP